MKPPARRSKTPPRTQRSDGWTADRRRAFPDTVAEGLTVEAACAHVGLSKASVYALRLRDPAFALGWSGATLRARSTVRGGGRERAGNLCARGAGFQADLTPVGEPGRVNVRQISPTNPRPRNDVRSCFRRGGASLDEQISRSRSEGHLLRVLGLGFGIAVSVGSMIGGGVVRAPGQVLDHLPLAGLAMTLWLVAGLHSLLEANVISEVMTRLPRSGGLFVPARAVFGETGGLLIGWTDWLNCAASIAALAIASGEYAAIFVPALRGHQGLTGATFALFLFAVNWPGVREGATTQIVSSLLKVAFLIGVAAIVFASPAAGIGAPAPAATSTGLTVVGVILAYQLVFGVYSGWPNAAYFSEECTEAGRDIPRALISSVVAVTVLYLAINLALLHALPVETLRKSELPIGDAIARTLGPFSFKLVGIGAIVILVGCLNANIMTGMRILYGLADEGLFLAAAKRVNRGGTPDVALALTAGLAILLTLTGQFETMFLIMGALSMLPLLFAEAALFVLRRTRPDLPRPYSAVGYPWLPALVLGIDTALLAAFLIADARSGLFIILAVLICLPTAWLIKRRQARRLASVLPGG